MDVENREMSNNSIVEDETPIKGWNWGAFMFNWVWGIGNGTYWPLLTFVPFLSIIWPFVCAIKGNEWAYMSGQFKSVSEFNAVQKSWNKAGLVSFAVSAIFAVVFIGFYSILIGTLLSTMQY